MNCMFRILNAARSQPVFAFWDFGIYGGQGLGFRLTLIPKP